MIAMPMNPIRIASGAASSELNKARPPPASSLLMLTMARIKPTIINIGESAHPITGKAAIKAPSALRLFDVFAIFIIIKCRRLAARRRVGGLVNGLVLL